MSQNSNSAILRQKKANDGGRSASGKIKSLFQRGTSEETNNNSDPHRTRSAYDTGEEINLPDLNRKKPRLTRTIDPEADMEMNMEKMYNSPKYHPGIRPQPVFKESTKNTSGLILRREHKGDLKRIARSEYLVTWESLGTQKLSAKVTDPREFTKQKKIEDLAEVNHLILEDEDNILKELPMQVSTLSKITRLDVKYSRIKVLPQWLSKMTRITELSVTETQLMRLDAVCHMTQMTSLNLSSNRLESIPKEIGNLVNLNELQMTANNISTLPPDIKNLQNLKKFNLSGNRIRTLPEQICNLKNLSSLDVSRNQLEKMPDRFSALERLLFLTLSHNRLPIFPPSLIDLRALKHLTLASNKIKIIPKDIDKMATLDHLNLRKNQIAQLHGFPPKVKVALLDSNRIENIDAIANNHVLAQHLEVLSIKENEIPHIPKALNENRKLKALYIDGNPVENLPEELGEIEQLKHLTLNKTKLRKLPGNFKPTGAANNRLSLLDVQNTNMADEAIQSSTKGIDSKVVANNIKRSSRNSALLLAQEDEQDVENEEEENRI